MRLLGESVRVAKSQPVSTGVTLLLVSAVCAVILSTTGQTVAAERQVLARIDEAGTRSLVVSDTRGSAGLQPVAVERIAGLSGVEWVFGLGPAVDSRAASVPGGQPVATREIFGDLPDVVTTSEWDREPGTALVGDGAQVALGMRIPAGGAVTSDGDDISVVGWFAADDPVANLGNSLLVAPAPDSDTDLRTVHILAQRPEDVAPLALAVAAVLGPEDPMSVAIETSEALADIRAAVQGELGMYGRRLVLMVLGAGLVLVALTVYGSVTSRRRDFGRRRALGAGRSTIAALVTLQAFITALVGAVIGAGAGSAIVWRLTGDLPDWAFVLAVSVLAVLSTVIAALPPAVVAALRDPVRVLRVP